MRLRHRNLVTHPADRNAEPSQPPDLRQLGATGEDDGVRSDLAARCLDTASPARRWSPARGRPRVHVRRHQHIASVTAYAVTLRGGVR